MNVTLATEIICDMRRHMASTNQAVEDSLDRIARTRAVVCTVWRAVEDDVSVADALGGVMDMLEAIGEKLGRQYDEDFRYLNCADKDGTTAG